MDTKTAVEVLKKHCGGIKELSYRARQPEEQIEYEKIANALQLAISVLGRLNEDKIAEMIINKMRCVGEDGDGRLHPIHLHEVKHLATSIVSGLTGKETP